VELRAYAGVLRRYWYIVVIVPVLVLAGVLYQASRAKTSYTSKTELSVVRDQEQPPSSPFYTYNDYYAYLASEYTLDDMVGLVQGNVFAHDVSTELAKTDGITMSTKDVQTALSSSRLNRILTIQAKADSKARAEAIAAAAGKVLAAKGTGFFGFTDPSKDAMIRTIQTATSATASTGRQRIILALQVIIGLIAGILIAFLVDYIDDTLRSPEMVSSSLRLPVIAAIPNGRQR